MPNFIEILVIKGNLYEKGKSVFSNVIAMFSPRQSS